MKVTHPLIRGTLILTLAGLATRFFGFLFRIYLSRQFSEESIGIHQLILPISALILTFSASGLQTSLSRYTALSFSGAKKISPLTYFTTTAVCSISLAVLSSLILFFFSDNIALYYLSEPRTAPLLRLLAISAPFASFHSVVNGYCYGIKKTGFPSFSQLLEQIFRILTVIILCELSIKRSITPNISYAVIGLITGEISAALFSLFYIIKEACQFKSPKESFSFFHHKEAFFEIIHMAWPLTASRLIITFILSAEASRLPVMLSRYGYPYETSLSVYGILTGMALPLVLLPGTITNSLSVLLLPTISEAEGQRNVNAIKKATGSAVRYCLFMGFICFLFFYLFGRPITILLFNTPLAGNYVQKLSFISPFLYLASTGTSILNGLGKTKTTFCFQLSAVCIRLLFVLLFVPQFGINAYFIGLLTSQMLHCILNLLALRKFIYYSN